MENKRILLPIAMLAVALCFAACSSDDPAEPGGGDPPDTTAPQVVGTEPGNGDAAVSVDDSVFVQFNEDMDTATGDGQITLSSGTVTGVTWYNDRVLVAGHTGWAEGVQVTATVGTGVTDAAGNALAAAYPFSFWTESTTELLLLDTTPAGGATDVNRDAGILLQFSADINMGTVNATNITITDAPPGKVDYAFTADEIENGLVLLDPADSLPASTEITVFVGTGVRSSGGLQLAAEESFAFTTGEDLDETPPTVVSTEPANGNMSVAADQGLFRMTFSEPVVPESVEPSTFNLEFYMLLMELDPSPVWSNGGTTLTIPLPNPLPDGLPASMTFVGFEDLAGNAQTTPYVYNVRVAGTADYYPVADGDRYLLEREWVRGDLGSPDPFEGDWDEYLEQVEVQPDDSFHLVRYFDPAFDTPQGWDAYRKTSSALQWIGFLDSNPAKEMFNSPLTILPLPISVRTWTSDTTVDIGGEGTYRATLDGRVVGQSDRPIPETGGNIFFKDAWTVVRTMEVEIQDGMTWFTAFTQVDTVVYAANMGDVMTYTYEEDFEYDEWEESTTWKYPFSDMFLKTDRNPFRRD